MALEWSNNLDTLYTCPLGQIESPGWLIQFLQEGTEILLVLSICPEIERRMGECDRPVPRGDPTIGLSSIKGGRGQTIK